MSVRRCLISVVCLLGLAGAGGCGEVQLTYTEVRRIDEQITEEELLAFIDIARHLPGGRLPELPALFLPPPAWNFERTLPVRDLVDAELLTLDERWHTSALSHLIANDRQTARRLRRWRMTREQFLGLTLTIAAAVARSTVPESVNLAEIQRLGQGQIAELRREDRPFHSLSPETMHDVLHRAAWITRFDRASRLLSVPEQNVRLVLTHWRDLSAVVPASLATNPMEVVADRLVDQGIPFEELPGSEFSELLNWDRATAIIGRDQPRSDSEAR